MAITPIVPPSWLSSLPSGIWSGVQSLPVFPNLPGQNIVVSKGPMWSTEVIRSASGRERRTAYWPYPLWQFEVSFEDVRHKATNDELVALWEFFSTAQGQFAPWLFVDPSDNAATAASTINTVTGGGTADGSTKTFQMMRSLNTVVEPVYDVYETGAVILDNGGAGGAHTFLPNGIIHFGSAPANGHTITWTGNFYFGCRFLQDNLTFEQIVNTLWSGKKLAFTSLRA